MFDYRDATTQAATVFGMTDGTTVPNIAGESVSPALGTVSRWPTTEMIRPRTFAFLSTASRWAASDATFGEAVLRLPDAFPVFQDGGTTDHAPGLVASMALVDHAMTDAAIVGLGGPKASGFASIYDPRDPPEPPPPPPAKGFTVVFLLLWAGGAFAAIWLARAARLGQPSRTTLRRIR